MINICPVSDFRNSVEQDSAFTDDIEHKPDEADEVAKRSEKSISEQKKSRCSPKYHTDKYLYLSFYFNSLFYSIFSIFKIFPYSFANTNIELLTGTPSSNALVYLLVEFNISDIGKLIKSYSRRPDAVIRPDDQVSISTDHQKKRLLQLFSKMCLTNHAVYSLVQSC